MQQIQSFVSVANRTSVTNSWLVEEDVQCGERPADLSCQRELEDVLVNVKTGRPSRALRSVREVSGADRTAIELNLTESYDKNRSSKHSNSLLSDARYELQNYYTLCSSQWASENCDANDSNNCENASEHAVKFILCLTIVTTSNVTFGSVRFILRPCQHESGHIDDRPHIQVRADERTLVHSARSSWWSPI